MTEPTIPNPYVGPRTFERAQRHLFFGREREARDLLARVVSQRLTLFYAQSGVGKSSLVNTRLIPQLEQEAGFAVLPVGRISGALPASVESVDNIFLFNLMLRLNQDEGDPQRFAHLSLSDFLAHLVSDDGQTFRYVAGVTAPPAASGNAEVAPYVLIIDQFEEIITTHLDRWQERTPFFQQLNQAMLDDPNLWIVLVLREDYVASLDPFAGLMAERMRSRFYMQRMEMAAALEAVQRPAKLGNRPFEPGVAEVLVDNLRRIKVLEQASDQLGQYIEPVQLQVVCYQLWERLKERPPGWITAEDLQQSGDVDSALAAFYDEAIAAVFTHPAINVAEWQLRNWFDKKLITEAGTRGTVFQGPYETADMPNRVVQQLSQHFLLRSELRAGGTWIELMHDRFVQPILQANQRWLERQSPLLRAARDWENAGRDPVLLYLGQQLKDALNASAYNQHEPIMQEFLTASQTQADILRTKIWHDEPRGQQREHFEHSLALIVGIDAYTNGLPRLTTAINDAKRLALLLHEEHGYYVHQLVEDATRSQLEELLTQILPQRVNEHDRLLIYFAGHGIALDGDDGPNGYLLPQDARPESTTTFIALNELFTWLNKLLCRHLLVILDCNFVGEFSWKGLRTLPASPEPLYQEQFDRLVRNPAWQLLLSSAQPRPSADTLAGNSLGDRPEQGEHSIFAGALLHALQGDSDRTPTDGVITSTELYHYIQAAALDASAQPLPPQAAWLWTLKKHNKGEYVFRAPNREPELPPAHQLTEKNNPYRGLDAYEERDAELFFGRTVLIQELAANVMQRSLTVVLGASGAGKSSLVKAGLVPYLRKVTEQANGSEFWRILSPMRPADSPIRVLHNLLSAELYGLDRGGRATPLAYGSRATRYGLTQATRAPRRSAPSTHDPNATATAVFAMVKHWTEHYSQHRLLLVIDQLEELVTIARDPQESELFITLLDRLLNRFSDHLHVVFTLRSDFEPQFANAQQASALHKRWPAARFLVRPMSYAELREVVEGPAAESILEFDPPHLIEQLIDEVIYTPGALSMLSFTLSELYLMYLQRQEIALRQGKLLERTLTGADYQLLGGVNGSLRKRATEVYERLDRDHQATLRRLMLRMVAVEGNELARRRVPRIEVIYPSVVENQRVVAVIQRLADAQLVVEGSDDAGIAYIEPAHDALVRAWDKLLVWKREADEILPLQRRLLLAASEWQRAEVKNKIGLLWNNDPRLSQLQRVITPEGTAGGRVGIGRTLGQTLWPSTVVTDEPTWLNKLETEFVQQSIARRSSLTRRVVGLTLAIFFVVLNLAVFAEIQRQNASAQRDNAIDAEATAQAQAGRAEAARQEALQQVQIAETRLAAAVKIASGASVLLTAQAPTVTPAPSTTGSLLITPTFTPFGTPTPDVGATATTQALQAQLIQLQGTATAVAQSTEQAGIGQSQTQPGFTTSNANLRSGPGAEFSSVTVLPAQTAVTILAQSQNGWYQVQIQGQTGYISSTLISLSPPETPFSTEAPTALETPTSLPPIVTVVTPQAPEVDPVRSHSRTGVLPGGQFAKIWLGLEPEASDAQITLVMDSSVPNVTFWILDNKGLEAVQGGSSLSDIAIASSNSTAGFKTSGTGAYTVVITNDTNVDANVRITATNAFLVDDSGQTTP